MTNLATARRGRAQQKDDTWIDEAQFKSIPTPTPEQRAAAQLKLEAVAAEQFDSEDQAVAALRVVLAALGLDDARWYRTHPPKKEVRRAPGD